LGLSRTFIYCPDDLLSMLLVVICYVSAPTTDRAKTGRLSFDTAALLAAYSGWYRGMRDRLLSLTDSDICHTK